MEKLPRRAGATLNPQHYKEILDTQPKVAWLEVSPEYYLGLGGAPHYYLEQLGEIYPIGINSRILSIGSAESVNESILNDLRRLLEIYRPSAFTELLCWTRWQGAYFKTPLPLPYTDEALDQVSLNIKTVQQALGRRILIENPAHYIPLQPHDYTEAEFFQELVRGTGCGVCLNVTNLYISSLNFHCDAFKDFSDYPLAAVQQLRLGGQKPLDPAAENILMVDEPNGDISKPLWRLYQAVLAGLPKAPSTSIHWSENLQDFSALLDLVEQTDDILFETFPIKARGMPR